MKYLIPLAFLVFTFQILDAKVLELNDVNFLEVVTGNPLVLVEFYSPTCPHCQKFAPVYERTAKKLHDVQPSVIVAKVNCKSKASNISCSKSSIRYVPWVVFFNSSVEVSAFGDRKRDEETLIKFVDENVNETSAAEKQQDVTVPKTPPLNTCDEQPPKSVVAPRTIPEGLPVTELNDVTFPDFVKSSPYVIVDYYAPWCSDCQRLSPLYEEAALQLQKTNPDIKFAKVDCNRGNVPTFNICTASKLKFFPWMVLYHNGEAIQHYNEENVPDTATIYNFITSGSQPSDEGSVVHQLDDASFDSTLKSYPYVLVNFYAPWCFYCKKMAPIYDDLATELKEAYPTVRLVKVDCSATNTKTKATCSDNDIAFLPTLKLFQNGKFVKEYEGDKTSKSTISSFITDAVESETSSKRNSMNATLKNENKTENIEKIEKIDKVSKKDSKKNDEDEEGSTKDNDAVEEEHSHNKKKNPKENHTKKKEVSKKADKKKSRMDRAARILKSVFKQFNHNKESTKAKNKQDDDKDEDDHDDSSNQWQQVTKDIHQISKDIHKMSKEFHKAISKKQPTVDRLVKAFSHLVKSKDDDEDDF